MLSTTAEHALRALVEMASISHGEAIRGKQLATATGIPANYLSKILSAMSLAGLIDATRGCGGGYRLRRQAAGIRICEVVELFDRQRWKQRCFLSCGRECDEAYQCPAHEAWARVRAAYNEFMESTTIADFVPPGGGSKMLVKINGN